jgi:ATP-dependent DNA ligase
MLAAAVDTMPDPAALRGGGVLEPKFDGWRAVVFCSHDGVYVQSRSGKPLGLYFPDVTRIVRTALPANVVLDGELIVWDQGRTNFALLQRRVAGGAQVLRVAHQYPAHLVVFDLLQGADGQPLLDQPLAVRRELLVALLDGAPTELALCPQTTSVEVAREWLSAWTPAGVEGVVAKGLAGRYQPGKRGWLKYRVRSGAEAIVGGVTGTITDPQILLLGRFDTQGRLRYVGRTHLLAPHLRRVLLHQLVAVVQRRSGAVDHPWPRPLPASWSGQLGQQRPLDYHPVAPTLVVEVEVDSAYEHHRWRHGARYLRVRGDLSIYDVPLIEL